MCVVNLIVWFWFWVLGGGRGRAREGRMSIRRPSTLPRHAIYQSSPRTRIERKAKANKTYHADDEGAADVDEPTGGGDGHEAHHGAHAGGGDGGLFVWGGGTGEWKGDV